MNQNVSKRTVTIIFLTTFAVTGYAIHSHRAPKLAPVTAASGPNMAMVEKYKVKKPAATPGAVSSGAALVIPDQEVVDPVEDKKQRLEYLKVLEAEAAAQERREDLNHLDQAPRGLPKTATIVTNLGSFQVKLSVYARPFSVLQFTNLADGLIKALDPAIGHWRQYKFYEGRQIFRVLPTVGFQGGCPMDEGSGDPGFREALEPIENNVRSFKKGTIALLADKSGKVGSQFFVFTQDVKDAEVDAVVIGRVIGGWPTLKKIMALETDFRDRPKNPVKILHVQVNREQDANLAYQIKAMSEKAQEIERLPASLVTEPPATAKKNR